MSARRFQFTVEHMIGKREVELVVTYSVSRFYEATREQPAEGGEVELVSIKHGGQPITLSDDEEEALLTLAQERAGDDMAEDDAAREDWRYQEYRDRLLMGEA